MKKIKIITCTLLILITLTNYANAQSTGSITIYVLDNLIQYPANISIYKDGNHITDIYLKDGKTELKNLEYGTYKFEVTDKTFITASYKAYPHQESYDSEIGEIEISEKNNNVIYTIYGDFPETKGHGLDVIGTKVETNKKNDSKFALGLIIGAIICLLSISSISIIRKRKHNKLYKQQTQNKP